MNRKPQNILLIIIDSLRFDRLSCYGYTDSTTPFLDSKAKKGYLFNQTYSTAPWTVPAHGSIFTGDLPSEHGSHRKSKKFQQPPGDTLAGTLSSSNYQTAGFSANPWISSEFNFDSGFDHFEYTSPKPPFPEEEMMPDSVNSDQEVYDKVQNILSWVWEGNPGKRVINGVWKKCFGRPFVPAETLSSRILEWIDESDKEAKRFIFANYMDVHDPHYDDVFGGIGTPSSKLDSIRMDLLDPPIVTPSKEIHFRSEPENSGRARALYDDSVRELDQKLQRLFSELGKRIDLDDTLAIIVGDHGECMGEQGYWGHGSYLHEELVHVPLIVSSPQSISLDGINPTQPISIIDIPRFITEVANNPIDGTNHQLSSKNEGETIPLFAECTGPRPDVGRASPDGYRTVIFGGWKLIRDNHSQDIRLERTRSEGSVHMERGVARDCLLRFEQKRWDGLNVENTVSDDEITQKTRTRLSDLGYL